MDKLFMASAVWWRAKENGAKQGAERGDIFVVISNEREKEKKGCFKRTTSEAFHLLTIIIFRQKQQFTRILSRDPQVIFSKIIFLYKETLPQQPLTFLHFDRRHPFSIPTLIFTKNQTHPLKFSSPFPLILTHFLPPSFLSLNSWYFLIQNSFPPLLLSFPAPFLHPIISSYPSP